MFDAPAPRLFGLPPGADFPARLVAGLIARGKGQPPEAMGRVELFVNTRRMQRRVRELFAASGPLILPRVRLVTELGQDPALALPPPVSPLRRRLELARLVLGLLERQPDLAPRSSAFALADSLAGLLDEMQGEGVPPEVLHKLDVSDFSKHWERSRKFLEIVEKYFGADSPDPEARQRRAIEALVARWAVAPPQNPVIVAGSTGSRGATALFMAAVARLPQGAVVLPGFDFDMPPEIWPRLAATDKRPPAEDHPQYRFLRIAEMLDVASDEVRRWDNTDAPCPARNRMVSLALRPAPATDQWMEEGPRLEGLEAANQGLTLLESPSSRLEAVAVALRLRKAAEDGQTAALITPDRVLTRRVAAQLDRWGIEPDDSAGRPLALSPPGRFLLQTAALLGAPPANEDVLALLKHPLAHSGADRGEHLRHTRDLELHLRRNGPPHASAPSLDRWAEERPDRPDWARWLGGLLALVDDPRDLALEAQVSRHLALSEAFATGSGAEDSELWKAEAGKEARAAMEELTREAAHGGVMSPGDYLALLRSLFDAREVRDPVRSHPGVMIWGTLEARVQGADLVILGGLNDGIWPQLPPPDPWMNRQMRLQAGLLLPERRIGLSAHDFQQAIAAREVVLSRARRDDESETVPSRWLNRLTTLLQGIAPDALAGMRARGAELLAMAEALETPEARVAPATRPAPRPPEDARPGNLSVTEIQRLIRDPYEIYARHVLGLRPLDPLRRPPDARDRGTVLHKVLEVFVRDVWPKGGDLRTALRATTTEVLEARVPWPTARIAWAARMERVAPWFLETEAARRAVQQPHSFERKDTIPIADTGVTLTGKADRIDLCEDGRAVIYDYKTGAPPTDKQRQHFDKQLPLLAAMAEEGAFGGDPMEVARVGHISLASTPKVVEHDLERGDVQRVWEELAALIRHYSSRKAGFLSRRAVEREQGREGQRDYDHLARFGEWSTSDPGRGEDVG